MKCPMLGLLRLIWWTLIGLFRSRALLEAELLTLRHQLNVLQRQSSKRPRFSIVDRLIFTSLYQVAPNVLNALKIVEPDTVLRWHRAAVLALEIEIPRRQTKGCGRYSAADP